MQKRLITGWLALTMAAGICRAEEPSEPAKFYKLEFVVKEAAGSKVLNSRSYATIVASGIHARGGIRAGSKIPYNTGTANMVQIQQIDVGMNIDVNAIKEIQDKLAFSIVAEVSSIAEGGDQSRPTIRQNKWASDVVVSLKKPTLLFSSDNVDAKTQMQVEVTATAVP